jgi:hypothetical protein
MVKKKGKVKMKKEQRSSKWSGLVHQAAHVPLTSSHLSNP